MTLINEWDRAAFAVFAPFSAFVGLVFHGEPTTLCEMQRSSECSVNNAVDWLINRALEVREGLWDLTNNCCFDYALFTSAPAPCTVSFVDPFVSCVSWSVVSITWENSFGVSMIHSHWHWFINYLSPNYNESNTNVLSVVWLMISITFSQDFHSVNLEPIIFIYSRIVTVTSMSRKIQTWAW